MTIDTASDEMKQWLGLEYCPVEKHYSWKEHRQRRTDWNFEMRRLSLWPFFLTTSSAEWSTRRVLAQRWGGAAAAAAGGEDIQRFEAALKSMLQFLRGLLPATTTTSNASDAAIAALITGCVFHNLLLNHGNMLNHTRKFSRGAAGILGAVVTADHIREWAMLPDTAARAARDWIALCDWTQIAVSGGAGVSAADELLLNADPEWMRGAACALASAALLRARAEAVLRAAEEADPPIFAVVRALGGLEIEGERALARLRKLRDAVNVARAYWKTRLVPIAFSTPCRRADGWFEVTGALNDICGSATERRVLCSALGFGPTVWLVPRTQSRSEAAHALQIEHDRLRRYGADWDLIPGPRSCRFGGLLMVFVHRPPATVCNVEPVVWIRFSRVV